MKYAMNLRAEENDKRKDDPMKVDQLGTNSGTANDNGRNGDNNSGTDAVDKNWDYIEAAVNAIMGKGKGGKGGKGGPNTQCHNCWGWGHIAANCPLGKGGKGLGGSPPGLAASPQSKAQPKGKGKCKDLKSQHPL